MTRICPTPWMAAALAATLALPASAQSLLPVVPDQSSMVGGGSCSQGLFDCLPRTGCSVGGEALLQFTKDLQGKLHGELLDCTLDQLSDFQLLCLDPLGLPLVQVEVESLLLRLDSEPFPCNPDGSFQANLLGLVEGGKVTVKALGSTLAVVHLDDVLAEVTLGSGSLSNLGGAVDLELPIVIRFKVPGVIATTMRIEISLDTLVRATLPFVGPSSYCTGTSNSLGCVPVIGWSGTPSATHDSGFLVDATGLRNNTVGILVYGFEGKDAIPFAGGLLCLAPPFLRAPGQLSGGSPPPAKDCSGAFQIDLNALATLQGGASLLGIPGTLCHAQWWSREPDLPVGCVLSDALEFLVCY